VIERTGQTGAFYFTTAATLEAITDADHSGAAQSGGESLKRDRSKGSSTVDL
jgi:hypothetical protein